MTTLRRRRPLDIWPAFVDATASLLMVVVFALLIAIIGQFVLSTILSNRNNTLTELNSRISELTNILSLEKAETARLENLLTVRTSNLELAKQQVLSQQQIIQDNQILLNDRDATIASQTQSLSAQLETMASLKNDIAALTALRDRIQQELEQQIAQHDSIKQKLEEESQLNLANIAQVELLNRQMQELRQQLAGIAEALEVSEKDNATKQTKIDNLAERLNTALASKAQLLQKYRSDFFGRLREALSNHPDIKIDGDRFVLPSELLFETGSDKLDVEGKRQVQQLASTLHEISQTIPDDINWILRIDGHTDKRPIKYNPKFKSNWELSTARAISMVREMTNNGIPAKRMAATGFAEHHPLDNADTEAAYTRNRRIELKLTSR